MALQILPVTGIPLIQEGDNLPEIIAHALSKNNLQLRDQDILVIAHTIYSKANGDIIDLRQITPSEKAKKLAKRFHKDPRHVQVVLNQGKLLKAERGIFIIETPQGFVCANGGVDRSNSGDPNRVLVLPKNPDALAKQASLYFYEQYRKRVAVIISDSWGRALRIGITNIALGSYGIPPLLSYVNKPDLYGYVLRVSNVAIVDELASAAELVMGEANEGVPVALIRGYHYTFTPTMPGATMLNRHESLRLFK